MIEIALAFAAILLTLLKLAGMIVVVTGLLILLGLAAVAKYFAGIIWPDEAEGVSDEPKAHNRDR